MVAFEARKQRYAVVEDPEEDLSSWLSHDPEQYAEAMRALGLTPVIDLDV